MIEIPNSASDITAPWMAAATGTDITSVRVEQIGEGIGVSSALYRVSCEGGDVPSYVVKLQALDEAAVFTSTVLRMYVREVAFFEQLAADVPIRVPTGYASALDDDGSRFVIVMEDMGAMRVVDQNEGMSIADAEQSVDELARWHAEFWGKAAPLVESGAAMRVDDPTYPAILPMVFGEGWEKLQAELPEMPDAIRDIAPGWTPALEGLLATMAADPTTIYHGDYRADNILFDDDGSVVLLDFQLTGYGTGAYDLAYFVTQSLAPDVASAHEKALFDRYVDGLIAAGVPAGETEGLWEQYRTAAYFCLVYPVVASRGMDLGDPRQRELVRTMLERYARAADELRLGEFAS